MFCSSLSYGGFLPTVDGYTLTDTIIRLFQKGKIPSVPFIAGYVSHEGAGTISKNITEFTEADIGTVHNLSASHIQDVLTMYGPRAVNSSWGQAYNTGPFFTDAFRAALAGSTRYGEGGISGGERWAALSMCKKGKKECAKTWSFRYGAPSTCSLHRRLLSRYLFTHAFAVQFTAVGTAYPDAPAPLNFVAHSADNSYLQVSLFCLLNRRSVSQQI